MIKVTLEFATPDEVIVAMAKLVGTALPKAAKSPGAPQTAVPATAAPASTRRGRSDKGQPRGPHKADAVMTATQVLADEKTYIAEHAAKFNDAAVAIISPFVDKTLAILETAAPDAATTSDLTQSAEAPAAAVPVYTLADIQRAVQKIFVEKGLDAALKVMQQFGATSYAKIKPEQRIEFMAKVAEALK